MGLHRSNPSKASLMVFALLVGIVALDQARGQQPATQPAANSDIELGKPVKYPTLITPTLESGVLKDDHHGENLSGEDFLFNPATHEVSVAKSSQRHYGDCRIDAANYNSDLTLFNYLTTEHVPIGTIILTCAHKKLVISYNYVVSPARDKPAPIDPSTYRAFVQFTKGDECNKPGTTLTVRRNQDPPSPLADMEFTKINRKTDVITWTLERGGTNVKSGTFGFPIVATDADLVKYVVQLP